MDEWGKKKNGQAYIKKQTNTNKGSTNDLSTKSKTSNKKQLKKEGIAVEDITFSNGDLKEGIDYKITEYGKVDYIGGFEKLLTKLDCRKLTNNQIKKLASDFDNEYLKDKDEIHEYLGDKETENTSNFASLIGHDLNFGFIENGNRVFMVFAEHISGDIRGNYKEDVIYEISDIDDEVGMGDPKSTAGGFIDPTLKLKLNIGNEKYNVRVPNGFNENDWFDESGQSINSIPTKYGEEYEIVEKAFEQYANSK